MKLSKKELDELLAYKRTPNEDDVRYKEIIKEHLVDNNKIIYLLNNKELEDAEAENDEYFGINILPYYLISPTQHNVQNFICYETSFDEVARYNSAMKHQEVIFYILCHQATNIEKKTGIARHDLIAAVLIDEFQGCNFFGNQLKLVEDKPSVVDTDYAARTLVFEQQTPNSLSKNGKTINLRK